jgi:hypothetical protein
LVLTLATRVNAEVKYSSDGGTRVDVVCGIRE